MKRISLTLATLLITFIMIQGCSNSTDSNNEEIASEKIIGTWSKSTGNDGVGTIIVEFTERGNYEATFNTSESDEDLLLGNYEINGATISLFDEDCGLNIEGKYELSFDDNIVNFKLKSDDCENRVQKITGDWEKYPVAK